MTKNVKALPKNAVALPGAVVEQSRTYKGRVLGPYYFRVWRCEGRVCKRYVPRLEVDAIRAACSAHQKMKASRQAALRDSRESLAECKRILKALRARNWGAQI